MRDTIKFYLIIPLCLGAMISCHNGSHSGQSDIMPIETEDFTKVETMTLNSQPFYQELLSNGKVEAVQMSDLFFQSEGILEAVFVKNGDRISQGQAIARLDAYKLQKQAQQAKGALDQSWLEMQDILIGQGYGSVDTAAVPRDVMALARSRSGYSQSLATYELAVQSMEDATLVAPFAGVVANMDVRSHDHISTSNPICTLIGSQGLRVTFPVLESELSLARRGDKIHITPFSDPESVYEGVVTEVNPLVDSSGMVSVRAQVSDASGSLFTGMNVRVSVRRSQGERLVVPKTSVLVRNGRQVVFTVKDGKAQWNYVQTGLENTDSYSIEEGLSVGDEVIISGNVSLAHESPVSVVNK